MSQRDLTKQFESFRNGFRARRGPKLLNKYNFQNNSSEFHDIERQSLIPSSSSASQSFKRRNEVENKPTYLLKLNKIENLIKLIENNLILLNKKHKKRLLISFDNSEEIKEKEINSITLKITDQFYQIKKLLESSNRDQGRADGSGGDGKIEKIIENNLNKNLAKKIQKLNLSFRKLQKNYILKLKQQKSQTQSDQNILGLDFINNQDDENLMTTDQGQGGMKVVEYESKLDEKRNEEILEISKNIQELGNIFQDLSILVIDQGTILDRIDYNLENIEVKVEKGVDELIIADQYSQSSRPFKCIMILLGIIVLEALILLIQS